MQTVPEYNLLSQAGSLEQWGRQGSTYCQPRDFPHKSVPAIKSMLKEVSKQALLGSPLSSLLPLI